MFVTAGSLGETWLLVRRYIFSQSRPRGKVKLRETT